MHRKFLVVCFSIAALALPALAQTSNLNGTWKLNVSKSSFGSFPPPAGETNTITVTGSDFKEQVTSSSAQGSQTYARGCALDGKEVVLAADDPRAHIGAVTLSKIQCSLQGNSVVVLETANLRGTELTDKLTFSPSDDGKTMTMDSHIASATINGDRKMVYDKQEGSSATAAPAASSAASSGPHPDLSGTWELSLSKSNFFQIPPPASQTDTIVEHDPAIDITADQKGGMMGDTNTKESFTTDGKESTWPGMGGATVSGTAHWDGSALVVDSKTSFQGADVKIKDTFTLSADGKTLTDVTHIESGMGDFDMNTVYDKQ
ncbi:MAG TPA: hypothetical protein VJO53_13640 [Candidatus Acidoferrales bacterium]|nr:hypothetical protein [Candidatus Acidoferrales bacterium]